MKACLTCGAKDIGDNARNCDFCGEMQFAEIDPIAEQRANAKRYRKEVMKKAGGVR